MHLPDRQRAGVFGTAAKIVAWMADPRLRAWVVEPQGRPPPPRCRRSAGGWQRRHPVLAVQRRRRQRRGPHRRPHDHVPDRGRAPGPGLPSGRVAGPGGGGARRGGQRVPLAGPARPLQPLRLPGHRLRLLPAELVPGGRVLGPGGHEEALGGGQHPGVRRRYPRGRVLGGRLPHLRGVGRPGHVARAPPGAPAAPTPRRPAGNGSSTSPPWVPCPRPGPWSCRAAPTRWWSARSPGTRSRPTARRPPDGQRATKAGKPS